MCEWGYRTLSMWPVGSVDLVVRGVEDALWVCGRCCGLG